MDNNGNRVCEEKVRYALYGALFGVGFPIVATLIDVWIQALPFNFSSIISVQKQQPLHWIIDSAPLFLGLFASLAGHRQDKICHLNNELEHTVQERTGELVEVNRSLETRVRELKASEMALRESEEKFKNVTEQSPNMIFINHRGRVVYVNRACVESMGYSREELCAPDFDFLTVIAPEYRDRVSANLRSHMQGEDVEPYDYELITKDGRSIQSIISTKLVNYDGERAILGIVTDMTERKAAAEERRLLREQLARANRMESLGLLAGGVAHDLNNILGPLVAYPEIIRLKIESDSPLLEPIERIERSAQRAADVVQDLLTMARRGRYDLMPTDANEVVQSYLQSSSYEDLRSKAPNVDVEVTLEPSSCTVQGSAPHLFKVLLNLVANAFDAMPHGGHLTLTTERRRLDRLEGGHDNITPGNYVIIRVSDTGVGIAPKDVARLFEPFYSRKDMGRSGSGLGLAIVYGVIKDHNGYIDVLSEVDRGSDFVVYLPVAGQEENVASNESTVDDIRGHEKILIVDDLQEQRDLAATVLASLGYDVDVAAGGREAVAYLKAHTVDVVVLDMIMEDGFDGLDTYREMVKHRPGQRAIIASGFSETARVKEAMRLGVGQYIKKPYTMQKLGMAIRRILALQASSEPVRPVLTE